MIHTHIDEISNKSPVLLFFMLQISKPQLGETIPGHVHCTIEVDISRFTGVIREEWEGLRDHDGA